MIGRQVWLIGIRDANSQQEFRANLKGEKRPGRFAPEAGLA